MSIPGTLQKPSVAKEKSTLQEEEFGGISEDIMMAVLNNLLAFIL